MAIDGQVCFQRRLFANPVKLQWCITGPIGPLRSTNQNWLCARLLPMAVLIYPVVCVHSCQLLWTQYHYLWPNGRTSPHCPPTSTNPPLTHLLISNTCNIIVVVKNYLKNQQWILHGRVSYETVAIAKSALLLQQVLRDYNAAQENCSYFNVLKWYSLKYIQNVTTWLIFPNPVTYRQSCEITWLL